MKLRMKVRINLRTIFAVAAAVAVLGSVPARMAQAEEHHGWGDYDDHHVWHSSEWWHGHRPGWFWGHHPEWAEHHPEWRHSDGDWDDHHHWHDRDWWYGHHTKWVAKHHPHWERWRD